MHPIAPRFVPGVWLLCFSGWLMAGSSFAAPAASSSSQGVEHVYGLNECYDAAVHRSELVAIQQELINQAEEHVKQSVGAILPNISGSASRRWQQTVQSGTGGAFYPPLQD